MLTTTISPEIEHTHDKFFIFNKPGTVEIIYFEFVDHDVFSSTLPNPWKVLRVSWIPGSPIDWTAKTPTESPNLGVFLEHKLIP